MMCGDVNVDVKYLGLRTGVRSFRKGRSESLFG